MLYCSLIQPTHINGHFCLEREREREREREIEREREREGIIIGMSCMNIVC